MSKLPEGWLFESFDKIGIQVIDGDRGNNYPKQNEFEEEGFCLFLSAKNVTKRGFEFYEKQFINEEKDSLLRKGKLTRGDLILTTRGTVGNVAYYNELIKYNHLRINSGMVLLRTTENVDNLYLYKVMTSGFIQDKIKNISFGSAQQQLTVKEIKKFKVPLPPLEEQKKIADILSTVDQKIAFVEDKISQTQELKKGLMQKLLTQGIGHTEFKDSEIGRIPDSWGVVKLPELADKITSGGTPSRKKPEYYENGMINWLKTGELKDCYIYESQEKITEEAVKNSSAKLFPTDTVLIAMYGATIGQTAYLKVESTTNQACCAIIFNKNIADSLFYWKYFYFIKDLLIGKGIGAGQPNISQGIIKDLSMPLPPIEEQKQIAEILSTVDQKLEVLKDKKGFFQELKKGLMQKLLTGEVRV